MHIGQYVHKCQQFQLCIKTLRENLLESTYRSVLITGVFKNKPPQCKYKSIWDGQIVLEYLKRELSTKRFCQINF